MRRSTRLIAAAAALAIIAAACGDDKGTTSTTAGTTATTAAPATTAASTETTAAATETTAASTETTAAATETTAAPSADLDAENGKGAAAWDAAIDKATNAPQAAAEGNDILIAMPNLEGAAGGSFPEIREGAEAAVKFINEKLGGVGATADKPGRKIKLDVCVHGLTPDEALACANKIKESKPALIINGIDFFTPAMYPIFAGIPTMETVPIFVADFNTPGVLSVFGGCVSAFPAGALFLKDYYKADKVAVIYSDNAPGQQCYADTQKRFYDFLGVDNIGIPDVPGDPADNDANAQKIVAEIGGAARPAVYFGIQASDCAEYMKALAKAGFKGQIVASGSCNDQSVLDIPESHGVIFEQQSYIATQPELYSGFINKEILSREQALTDYGPTSPSSAFLRTSFAAVVFAYQVMESVVAAGGDPSDNATLQAALNAVDNYHVVGHPPVSCSNNAPDYKSVCKKSNTYTTWTGTKFEFYPGLENKFIDLTELLSSIPPRTV